MNQISVLETIAYNLKIYGTKIVYGLPSDDLKLMESLQNHKIEYLVAKDQRNALFMATGYTMVSKELGVCNIGKGPAVTNSMTGLLEAKSQCAPLLVIASGTDSIRYGSEKCFQETEQLNIVGPLVKWSHRLESKESIEWVLKKAVFMAKNGTPGPVYIEVPENIGQEMIPKKEFSLDYVSSKPIPTPKIMKQLKRKIQNSERPVILLGGGCKGFKNNNLIIQFAEQLDAPIFVSASGRGSVDENHSLFCGLGGLYCQENMKELIRKCDLFIALGSSLEETLLFEWEEVLRKVETVEININEKYFNIDINSFKIIGEAEHTVKELLTQLSHPQRNIWRKEVQESKNQLWINKHKTVENSNSLKVTEVLEVIQSDSSPSSIFVHENGLQDMWSYFYPYLVLKGEQDAIVPSEQTSLGFGCSAAIGVAKAKPDSTVIAFVGDGAFNMFCSELATIVTNRVPIIYVVLRNGGYGWLEYQNNNTHQQQLFVDKSIPLVTINHPQLCALQVSTKDELEKKWSEALQLHSRGKTVVFEVNVKLDDIPVALTKLYGDFPERSS